MGEIVRATTHKAMRSLVTLIKILIASLLLGAGLHALDITPQQILDLVKIDEETFKSDIEQLARWAIPHIFTGALIIVPLWIVLSLLMPPRR